MISKTRMEALVRAHDAPAVATALAENPALFAWRGDRGRNWLHLACGVKISRSAERAAASIATAKVLVAAGYNVSEPAFLEGDWKATPLWYAVGRGRNLALAEWLLQQGCDREHCLWAACFAHDLDAIRLLVRYGARVDATHEEGTPFIGAIKISHFREAELFLELGANVDARDQNGMTALHLMLKKGSDPAHLAMVIRHGARGDIPNKDGVTAPEILARKRDPAFRRLAQELG